MFFIQMYQRSGDMGLGVPFNIASYSLLTCMVAQVTGLRPGEFVHVIGDAHVYVNHIDALKEQLKRCVAFEFMKIYEFTHGNNRTPYEFPKLRLDPSITCIDDFEFKHMKVDGYECHGPIKMEMAV